MRIVAVDDERMALKNLGLKLKICAPTAEYVSFQSPREALDYFAHNGANVAFLDIHTGDIDGIELAKRVRELCPSCSIIFLTGFPEHAVEAFSIKANGYLVKPVSVDDLRRELEYVYSKEREQRKTQMQTETDRLTVQCFGNFAVYWQGEPLTFSRSKSKELFAYLIDRRGAQVTMAQIASVLWQDGMFDRSRNNQIHTYLHDLVASLQKVTQEEIVIRKRNAISVDTSKLQCDYFDFLNGDLIAINSYNGEYMAQYWWSEFTTGILTTQLWQKSDENRI